MARKKTYNGPVSLSNLFLKYKNTLKAPQGSVIKEMILVVKEEVGISLEEKHFSYNVNKKTISCIAPSVVRSEIKVKQDVIEEKLKVKLGEQNTPKVFL